MLGITKKKRAEVVLDYFQKHQAEKHELRTWFDLINSKLPKMLRFKNSYEFGATIRYLKSKGHKFDKKKSNINFKGQQLNIIWMKYNVNKKEMPDV